MKKSYPYILALFFFIFTCSATAQHKTKSLQALRIEGPSPVIDGDLQEAAWQKGAFYGGFVQYQPYNGKAATANTRIKVRYTDRSLFIAAWMDAGQEPITRRLSRRDDDGLTDRFEVMIDPFCDGLSGFVFIVTSAGVQKDKKINNGRHDANWDAVWKSAVKVDSAAWYAELEIPYAELRFPNAPSQTWYINFLRSVEANRELSSWNFVDVDQNGWLNQAGKLQGLDNIKPPLRLSFSPYLSAYANSAASETGAHYNLKGGMDLKYGINESFTLDMMLIPDFGQLEADDQVLNLGPFETFYSEKRQFFIEGKQMFDRAGVFYSRRIGGLPQYYDAAWGQTRGHETVEENPEKSQLINATKITGKTSSGLGLGVLNAMTLPGHATLKDTLTGKTRQVQTQGFANYNVSVVEQSLPHNSYISLINTNKYLPDSGFSANNTATEMEFRTRDNLYGIELQGALRHDYTRGNDTKLGYFYFVELGKISGSLQYEVSQLVESHTYDRNVMGYLQNNNELTNRAQISYEINKPTGIILNMHNRISARYSLLYKPREYTDFNIEYYSWTRFTNHLSFNAWMRWEPFPLHDYNEPRVEGRYFEHPGNIQGQVNLSTDYRKTLAIDATYGLRQAYGFGNHALWYSVSPRIQPSSKLTMRYRFENKYAANDMGFADYTEGQDTVFFGRRYIPTIENSITADYIINNKTSVNFRLRHYWSQVDFDKFYILQTDGNLEPTDAFNENLDFSYNAFNMKLEYSWNFAPGSMLTLVWKNATYFSEEKVAESYFNNLEKLGHENASNSFSVRLLYFIHYEDAKRFIQTI